MSDLYKYLSNDNVQQFSPHNDEAIAVDMVTPAVETALGIKGLIGGVRAYNGIRPFLGDIWNGRKLLFGTNSKKIGKIFYKENINPSPVYNPIMGNTYFPNSMAGKIKTEYIEQLPFLRYFTQRNKNIIKIPNNKNRIDANGFYNMKVKWKGKNYDYQYKINSYTNEPEFHNIKPYELLENEIQNNNLFDLLKK